MPKDLRKDFTLGRTMAHVRQKENGVYEIRTQIRGNRISVSAKRLDDAREKFIDALSAASQAAESPKQITMEDYAGEWLSCVKAPYVKPGTLADYTQTLECHIYPRFGKVELTEISALDVQGLLNEYAEDGHGRTAKKIYQVMSAVFDFAEADGKVNRSPMKKVVLPPYSERESVPLDRTEEARLVSLLPGDVYVQACALMLYTGLRRAELCSLEMSDGWISCDTAKQRKGVEKRREIPVSPMLADILTYIDLDAVKNVSTDALTRNFSKICPGHHLHELRHTFVTRCLECGIQREVVSLWAGHAADSSVTSQVYSHLGQNREHQIEEMSKFRYDLPGI